MYKALKRAGALTMGALMALSLAGCSGNSSTATTQAQATTAAATTTAAASTQAAETQAASAEKKEKITLRIGAGHTREGAYWTYAQSNYFQPMVAERVANETNYEIEWVEAYGGSVGKLGEELEAVEQGLLDIGVVCYAFEPSNLYLNSFTYSIPFTTPDPVVMGEIGRELYDEFPEFNAVFDKFNMINLSTFVTDNYDIYSSKDIVAASDLNGMKIGGSNTTLTLLEGTGAIPVQAGATEAYTGIQTGVYDAFCGPSYTVYCYKVQEVAPKVIQSGVGAQITASICMNKDSFSQLPAEVQNIILEVGADTAVFEAEYAGETYDKFIDELRHTDGIEVSELSEEAKLEWANMMPNVVGTLVEELNGLGYDGDKIVTTFLEKLAAHGYAPNREWEY